MMKSDRIRKCTRTSLAVVLAMALAVVPVHQAEAISCKGAEGRNKKAPQRWPSR